MKIMQKLVSLILVITFIIGVSLSNVNAESTPQLCDVEDYIISGSGTENDPYVLDGNCPYKHILDGMVQQIFLVDNDNQGISLAADFSGALSVKYSNTSYTNGGKWYCTGNYPSTISDGTLWIRNISYGSNLYISKLRDLRNTPAWWSYFSTGVQNVCGPDLVSYLTARGVSNLIAGACGYLFCYCTMIDAINSLTYSFLTDLMSHGYGLLTINYSVSYHGDWYVTSTETAWSTYPTVYVPASYYGTGVFVGN